VIELDVHDPVEVLTTERPEDHDLVDAVQELGPPAWSAALA